VSSSSSAALEWWWWWWWWWWCRVPGRPQQQIFEITSDGDQDEVERLEGIPHIAATGAVHVHERVDLAVHEEVVQVGVEGQLGIEIVLDGRDRVLVKVDPAPHGAHELSNTVKDAAVARRSDEQRTRFGSYGRLGEEGEQDRLRVRRHIRGSEGHSAQP